jgi:hypothetical protein
MHDVLRRRLMRKLESLPEAQLYQALDYIEFLESKYAPGGALVEETSGLQKFAESLEDRLRRKAVSPATIREAFQLIASADRVLSGVTSAGKQLLSELSLAEEQADPSVPGGARKEPGGSGGAASSRSLEGGGSGSGGEVPPRG